MTNLSSVLSLRRAVLAMCVLSLAVTCTLSSTNPCVAPDNGAGTVDLPALCPIVSLDNSVMRIISGLPPGSSIECRPQLSNFTGISRTPGGSLGGEVLQFSAQLLLMMQGTGALTGYLRTVQIPMVLQVHTAPRTPGSPFQTFDTDMFVMQGQLPPGDPDFDLLRVTAGQGFGLPSPGHTTLTRLPSGEWNVDSFFDITYRIDFVGAPGGPVAGMSGSTTDEIRLHQGLDIDQCKSADNGTGTIHLPAPCPMEHPAEPLKIVDGLPPGASLELTGQIQNYASVVRVPGGTLGGEVVQFSATMPVEIVGLILSSSYHRSLTIPLSTLEFHTAPRTPGEPVQSFPTDMFRMQGQLPPGDPDFDLLRITAGTDFGLPSPGHTTLRQLPGGDWHVDSFFDITYRIDFIGAPGGPMAGMSGSTYGRATFQQGSALPSTLCPTPDFLTTEQCPYWASDYVRVSVPGLTGHALFSPLIRDFSISSVTPGGDLGGDVVQGTCALFVVVEGDALAPYRRLAVMDALFVIHTGPRGTGKDVERFRTKLVSLEGQLPPGDPDFDLLRVTGGSGFGLPSPGHTTLTKLPGGDWAVDSFFDITYRIEFTGAPGGPIAGTSGDGTQRVHMKIRGYETCDESSLDDPVASTATVGEAYSHQLHVSDPSSLHFFGPGSDPFVGGLVLHPDGLITGVPTTPGCHVVEIELVSELGCRSLVPLSLQVAPAPALLHLGSSDYPPPVEHVTVACDPYSEDALRMINWILGVFHPTIPLPGGGASVLYDGSSLVRFEISTDGGGTFHQVEGMCTIVQRLDRPPTGDVIETEILSLSLTSASPIDVRLRESPTRPSLGKLRVASSGGTGYHIDSFFDIWTEISLDGGGSWIPSTKPVRVSGAVTISPPTLLNGTVGDPYEVVLSPVGGSPLSAFSSSTLPDGLELTPSGVLHGTPTTPGCYEFEVTVSDALVSTSSRSYSMSVHAPPLQLAVSLNGLPPGEPFRTDSSSCLAVVTTEVLLRAVTLGFASPIGPLPGPGGSQTFALDGTASLELSTDGGDTFITREFAATGSLHATHAGEAGGRDLIDTEILALDLVSVDPIGVRVRESPTLPSRGRTTTESLGGGQYRIDSFFDIFTEISLDDGGSWFPSNYAVRVILEGAPSLPSSARTYAIPHVFETSGRITNTQNTFDTQIFVTYSGGLHGIADGGGASVDLFLFDNAGQPLEGATGDVCNPCTFALDASTRKREIVIDDLIVSNGGGFDTPVKEGYGVVVVHGDSENVAVQGFVVNSHTSPFDLSISGYDPGVVLSSSGGGGTTSRTFVLPHVLESSGSILTTQYAFDTELYAVYTGGQAGIGGGAGATMDLFLFDDNGSPMQGAGGAVCNPCTYNMSPAERKKSIRIDDLIANAGGFGGSAVKLGFGIIVVSGSDPDGVNLQGFVVNSHTGPFDLSVFGFEPQPIAAAAYAGALNLNPKTFVLPHVLEKSGSIASTQNTFDTQIFATYSAGLAGLPSGGGASIDVYLFDEATGQLMKGSNGQDVCAPCTYSLSETNRKQTIRIDDLITTNGGGFDTPVKLGFGVIVVGGDEDHVALQGFVVNSHSGPLDVSMWGGPPHVVDEAPPVVAARAFVIPHVLERSGAITNTPFTFDTQIFATYTGGVEGSAGGGSGATLNLYLFDQTTGLPMTTATGEVCNPCSFALSETLRKQSIRIDDLIMAAGGFSSPEQKGCATLVVGGDANKVHLSSEIVNSHTGPFDLSVFGFDPVPITTASLSIPVVTVDPVAVDFGSVVVGSTEQSLITIRNGGGGLLVLTAPELTPDSDPAFSIISPPAETELGVGQATTMTIGFSPGVPTTDLSARLLVGSDGGTITIPLSGDGVLVNPDLFLTITPDTMIAKDPLKGKFFKPVKRAKPGKPIVFPNWANLLDETVAQGGFQPDESESDGAGGMRVGISFMDEISTDKWKPNKDSAKVRAWVRLTKWDFKKDAGKGFNALQKTLENKTFNHYSSDPTATPRGLDSTGYPGLLGRKFLKKQLTKLDPKKTPNRLFAELVALKFNIAASQLGKTPVGFGELELDIDTSMFHDMSIVEISERADSMMTYWQAYADSEYHEMFTVISALNRAFVGVLDTASFMATSTAFPLGKLVLQGQVDIDDVPFLKKPDPFVPTVITATTHEVESGEDEEFDDEESFEGLAVAAKLYQNYPNPFNPATTIAFRLREESRVSLKIHNLLGQEVVTLVNNEEMEEGLQVLEFNASQLSSGVYFYRIHTEGLEESALRTVETGKMILLK